MTEPKPLIRIRFEPRYRPQPIVSCPECFSELIDNGQNFRCVPCDKSFTPTQAEYGDEGNLADD